MQTYKKNQQAIKFVKDEFAKQLEKNLGLIQVCAPLLVDKLSGIQDNLNGTEKPVAVIIKKIPQRSFEIVQSLAKWKRLTLGEHDFAEGEGLYTNMHALRPDEESLDALHSVYVDQWDWEKVINPDERKLATLKSTVRTLYCSIKVTHDKTCKKFLLPKFLPDKITFVHTEQLAKMYPQKTSRQREHEICKKYGAVFLIGIGGKIGGGDPHDGRAPDYDDWSTPTSEEYKGLNGDILIWHPTLKDAFEVSSMGIRVDKKTLQRQLKINNCEDRLKLAWHQKLIKNQMPQTIGGGIGQSRMAMLMLQKTHIKEVQCSVWF